MKLKLFMLALAGILLSRQSVQSQTSSNSPWPTNPIVPAASTASPAPSAPAPAAPEPATSGATTVAPASSVPASGAPAPAPANDAASAATAATSAATAAANASTGDSTATPSGAISVPVDTNATPSSAVVTPAPVPAPAPVPVPVPAAVTTPAAPAAADMVTSAPPVTASIPLIEFQDVPLTVAIENLARQAGINYLLDPKIGYGQPDQNGQVKVEPTLSIRWENVTAEQALLALLNNYDLQLVMDPRTQIARISMKDPTAPAPLMTRVIQLKYASTSNMVDSVQAALTDRRSHVFPDVRTDQLIVVATENEQDSIDTLVAELDKPTRQVLIETKLVEVSSTPQSAKGVNWSSTLAAQNVSFGNGVLQPGPTSQSVQTLPGTPTSTSFGGNPPITTTPQSSTATTLTTYPQPSVLPGGLSWNTLTGFTPAMGFLNADGVQAVLSFLNSSYDAQTLSTPRVVTLDNEPALISVTRDFPVINVSAAVAGVSSGGSQITYSNIGTMLEVTPRITANDYIWLKVVPDVSSFFATVTKVINGATYQADEFDSRHIETQVMIPDANTLVMGGLVQDNPTASYTQVPVLGDIPVLGWAFKSQTTSMEKDNLIIFITPTIVKDDDFQPASSSSDFLATKPFQMKEPMNPNTMMDRAEPNWSNPAPAPGEFSQ